MEIGVKMQEGTRVKHTEKIKMSLKGIQHTYYSATGEETKAIEDISIDVRRRIFSNCRGKWMWEKYITQHYVWNVRTNKRGGID